MLFKLYCFFTILSVCTVTCNELEKCENLNEYTEEEKCETRQQNSKNRYILYDVNPSEGFNLRRDVYIRLAVFVKTLFEQNTKFHWYLVLPPWGNLYHWKSTNLGSQSRVPWGTFFDIASLQKYAPVLEMYDFLKEYPSKNEQTLLDVVYVLQNDEAMFKTGRFKDKNEIVDCPRNNFPYKRSSKGYYSGHFWHYTNITARELKCVIFHGSTSGLKRNLYPRLHSSVMFDRMEIALHDLYGSREYWRARRSMRYNAELYEIANDYRKNNLKSDDKNDKTQRLADWTKEKNGRDAIGGPYLSVHMRRRDFLRGRADSVPTIKSAAAQLRNKLRQLGLGILFVATDGTDDEYSELKEHLSEYSVLRYSPSEYVKHKFKDGGVAIIDQIICSHARYFVGTHESTFTFRIQEDREILGFATNTTFNRLCGKEQKCSPGGRWEIVW